jgi:hypothetical protein
MALDPARALGLRHGPVVLRWSEAETARYALAIGATSIAPRLAGDAPPTAFPAWAATLARSARPDFRALGLDPARVIHLSQGLELHGPFAAAGQASGESEVTAIHDSAAKGAIIEIRTRILAPAGTVLATTWARYLARGAGGFGGRPPPARARAEAPARPADAVIELPTRPDQARALQRARRYQPDSPRRRGGARGGLRAPDPARALHVRRRRPRRRAGALRR